MADPAVNVVDCFRRAAALLREAEAREAHSHGEAMLRVTLAEQWRLLGSAIREAGDGRGYRA